MPSVFFITWPFILGLSSELDEVRNMIAVKFCQTHLITATPEK